MGKEEKGFLFGLAFCDVKQIENVTRFRNLNPDLTFHFDAAPDPVTNPTLKFSFYFH
jgi:hypothetical protein